jgi:hypothetical protein
MREVWYLPVEEMVRNTGPEWLLAILEVGKTGGSGKLGNGAVEGLDSKEQSYMSRGSIIHCWFCGVLGEPCS